MKRILILTMALVALGYGGCSGNRLFNRTANCESCDDGCSCCDGGYSASPALSAPILAPGGLLGDPGNGRMTPGPY